METKKPGLWWLLFCNRLRIFSVFVLITILSPGAFAQCFSSSGNPVGGSQNMGSLDKNVMTIMSFFRYGFFDRYFEGDRLSDTNILKKADYSYTGMLIAYGLSGKLSLEAELGYFINKTKKYAMPEGYSLRGYGLSNAVLSAKYRVLTNFDKDISWTIGIGPKVPFRRSLQYVDNVRLPFDLQASTGAFGLVVQSYLVKQNSFTGMRYFLYNRLDVNGLSKDGYQYGKSLSSSVFVSKHLIKTSSWPVSITLIGQLRNEFRDYNSINGVRESSSGSIKVFISPQVNLSIHDLWNISLMADFPLYQYYNNIQLADRYSVGITLARLLPGY